MKAPTLSLSAALTFILVGAPLGVAQQGFIRTTGGTVRILQSNAGGDNIHIIDPATNTVFGEIDGIPIPHAVSYHPDGSVYYVSNEYDHTLDVMSTETLKVTKADSTDRWAEQHCHHTQRRKAVRGHRGEGDLDLRGRIQHLRGANYGARIREGAFSPGPGDERCEGKLRHVRATVRGVGEGTKLRLRNRPGIACPSRTG